MSVVTKAAVLLLVTLFILGQADAAWFCGKTRDCKWSSWSHWSRCSHACGATGEQFRTRYHAVTKKCRKGKSCTGPSKQTRACNRYCGHGHVSWGHCICDYGWYGPCCQWKK